jgi:hypothetical protein
MNDPPPSPKITSGRALPLLLLIALAIASAALMAWRPEAKQASTGGPNFGAELGSWTPPPAADSLTFSLTIDYGNGERRQFDALPWSESMTVGTALRAAKEFRPGVDFTQQGQGAMALLTSLDGVANDSTVGRFWIYDVDGHPGEVSFEKQPVAAGQQVRWKYSTQDPKPVSRD